MDLRKFVDALRERAAERRAAKRSAFDTLALLIANGGEPRLDAVEQALAEAGKTPQDLQDAVDLILDRRRWVALLADEPALFAELKEITRQKEVLAEEARALRRRHEAEGAAASERELQIQQRLIAIGDAKIRLLETSSTRGETNRLVGPTVANVERLRELEKELADAEAHVAHWEKKKTQRDAPSNVDFQIDQWTAKSGRLKREKAALEERLKEQKTRAGQLAELAFKP